MVFLLKGCAFIQQSIQEYKMVTRIRIKGSMIDAIVLFSFFELLPNII